MFLLAEKSEMKLPVKRDKIGNKVITEAFDALLRQLRREFCRRRDQWLYAQNLREPAFHEIGES